MRATTTKQAVTGGPELICHFRIRYNADQTTFLIIDNSTVTGPTFDIAAGTITAKRRDGTTIGTVGTGWSIGDVHTLSIAITFANTATGKLKIWLDSTAILNLTNVQTVNTGGSVATNRIVINGMGIWDDIGFISGSGGWVDADVPLKKWVRLRMVSASGFFTEWEQTYGSGTTHLNRINENPTDTTNGVRTVGGNGLRDDYALGTRPANIGTIWGVQHVVSAQQAGGPLARTYGFGIRDGPLSGDFYQGGVPNVVAAFTLSPTFYHRFYRTNPHGNTPWGANYDTTQIELVVA
jgi:hypothetical protein